MHLSRADHISSSAYFVSIFAYMARDLATRIGMMHICTCSYEQPEFPQPQLVLPATIPSGRASDILLLKTNKRRVDLICPLLWSSDELCPGIIQAYCKRKSGPRSMIDLDDRNILNGSTTSENVIGNDNETKDGSATLYRKRRRSISEDDSTMPSKHGSSTSGVTRSPNRIENESGSKLRVLQPADLLLTGDEKVVVTETTAGIQIKVTGSKQLLQNPTLDSANERILATSGTASNASDDAFELEKESHATIASANPDEPCAADYDPDLDRVREHESRRQQINSQRADSPRPSHNPPIADDEEVEDDMFASPKPALSVQEAVLPQSIQSKAMKLDESMLDSWADTEGYYRIMIGELLDGRYAVHSILGKGVFSAVVKCIDQEQGETVAIKVIRNNDVMRKAGLKEINLLEKLMAADPDDRKHIVRLRRTFEHRNHLCLVFESLSLNLREVLKKFGRDNGINIKAVRAYAQQIFLALSLLRKCDIMHADLKPDNILVSESRTMLKICDLGSASDVTENTPTAYLASRFYRAPEVILGLPYGTPMDVWAIGCTLYELYTGKILFPGRTNNQMLRLFMECRGRIPQRLLKKAVFAASHFDDEYNFRSTETDKLTGEQYVRVLNITKATDDLRKRLLPTAVNEERALMLHYID